MANEIKLPSVTSSNYDVKMDQLLRYIYQLVGDLNYNFSELEKSVREANNTNFAEPDLVQLKALLGNGEKGFIYPLSFDGEVGFNGSTTFNKTVNLLAPSDIDGNTAPSNNALNIGDVNGQHIEFDTNEIMAKSNSTTPSGLFINGNGGIVRMNAVDAHVYDGTSITTGALYLGGGISSSSKRLLFTIPFTRYVNATNVICTSLNITVIKTNGGYAYARSGSSGGTYTQLTGNISIWANGKTTRTNEVSGVTCTIVPNVGITVAVDFVNALANASGNTAAVTNNTPLFFVVNGTFSFS